MIKSGDWERFVSSVTKSRPWIDNNITKEISDLVPQEDIAGVIYSLFGSGAVNFLSEANRDLDMASPLSLIKSEEGREAVKRFLMSNPWL